MTLEATDIFWKALGCFRRSERTRHVRAADPRCAALSRRETRRTALEARSAGGRVPLRAKRAPARVPRAFVSRWRARAGGTDGENRAARYERSFQPEKSDARGPGRTVESNARVGSGVISGVILADSARRASAAVQSRARRATKCPANARRDPVCRECALYAQTDSAARGGSRPFTRTFRVRGSRRVLVEREVSRVSTD